MPKKLLLILALLFAVPSRADAQEEVLFVVIAPVVILEVAVTVAASVTSIGTAVVLSGDQPRLGWPIAAMVAGGLSTAWGALITGVAIRDDAPAWVYGFSLTPLALGITSLALGAATFVKRSRVRS